MMVYENMLSLIGNTPVVKLRHIRGIGHNNVFVKLERFNPGGSLKDRPAKYIIEEAEKAGLLRSNSTIIESTSGNFGAALALIGALKRYRVICVIDPKTPCETRLLMEAYGAKLVVVDKPDSHGSYQKTRIDTVRRLAAEIPYSFVPDQYGNPNNPTAHRATAEEILSDLGRQIDFLVCSVSTGGHISGIAKVLKQRIPYLKVVGVEPEGSVIFGGRQKAYLQTGSGLSFVPPNIDRSLIDQHLKVSDKDAITAMKRLIREEGIVAGMSSGSVVFAALRLSRGMNKKSIVCVLPDAGEKYLPIVFDNKKVKARVYPAIRIEKQQPGGVYDT